MVLRFSLFICALLFVSCTDVERDSPYDPEGINYRGGSSSSSSKQGGLVVVSCDMTYRTVVIGSQTWMAENLNCNVEGSKCYGDNPANCATYGRLYDWTTAMALPSSCNNSSCASQINANHRGICPSGWHIPSNADWDKLVRYVDGNSGTSSPYDSPTAGRYLKSASGWSSNGNGTDDYGFAALPGGDGDSDGSFNDVGDYGYWWSSSEYNAYYAYGRGMFYDNEYVYWYNNYNLGSLFSVRCLQDNSSAPLPPSSSSVLPSSSSVATYTVTYNAGTGVTGVTVPSNQTKTYDVALTLSSAVPARTGYAFVNWNTSANGTGTSYVSGASYTDNAGVTL
jgi:uncharacterized protein (TIGR02145 family)